MDAEGKSRGCAVVEFKMEESMKKAAEVLNKHSLSGRPLKVKEVSSFFSFFFLGGSNGTQGLVHTKKTVYY